MMLRSVLLVMSIVLLPLAAEEPVLPDRAERALVRLGEDLAEAEEALDEALREHAEQVAEAKAQAIASLSRLAERERDYATQALIHRRALAIDPQAATAARTFFEALGTLDKELADAADAAGGVNLLAAADPYDPFADQLPGTPLAELRPETSRVGWEQVQPGPDLPANFGPMVVRGEAVPQSVLMHPPPDGEAYAVYAVPAGARELVGACAVVDRFESRFVTPLVYVVSSAGRELWRSPPLKPGSQALIPFRVPVAGRDRVTLTIECPGAHDSAMALWVSPTFR